MSSTRFPGKVLRSLPWGSSEAVLVRIARQLKNSKKAIGFVVATSSDPSDDPIERICVENNIDCFRGSLTNVYQRYCEAAQKFSISQVVRLTGDNPLVDVGLLDEFIKFHIDRNNDYTHSTGLPLGCNFEIAKTTSLLSLASKKMTDDHREHVTLYFKHFPSEFKTDTYTFDSGFKTEMPRATIDYPSDYAFWNLVALMNPKISKVDELRMLVNEYPWLIDINKSNHQKTF